jgi:hypothetical protein
MYAVAGHSCSSTSPLKQKSLLKYAGAPFGVDRLGKYSIARRPDGGADKLFDANGKLGNEGTRNFLKDFMQSYDAWISANIKTWAAGRCAKIEEIMTKENKKLTHDSHNLAFN